MTDINEVIENLFLEHAYDPVKAHEYYLKNRKLTPRKTLNEDEAPAKSPSGALLVGFSPRAGGYATYSDGSKFGINGWVKGSRQERIKAAQDKLDTLKKAVAKLPPEKRAEFEKKIAAAQAKVDKLHEKSKVTTKPTKAAAKTAVKTVAKTLTKAPVKKSTVIVKRKAHPKPHSSPKAKVTSKKSSTPVAPGRRTGSARAI